MFLKVHKLTVLFIHMRIPIRFKSKKVVLFGFYWPFLSILLAIMNGFRSGAKVLYHCLFMFFWEQVWATTSYIKFSYAKVNGLEWIPQIVASSSIKSIAFLVSSSNIMSMMLIQRCSNNLIECTVTKNLLKCINKITNSKLKKQYKQS